MQLEERLRGLGDRLDLAASASATDVLAQLDASDESDRDDGHGMLRFAAVIVLVVAAVVTVTPSARRAVADWFGLDGVKIERDSGLDVPVTADPVDAAAELGVGTVVGQPVADVLVSEFAGSLDSDVLAKTLGEGSDVVRVDVAGSPGLWIDGDPHEVVLLDGDGDVVVRRFAGNTLLWEDGDLIRRLEGFDTLAAALAHAAP